jgi:hypothetical protein
VALAKLGHRCGEPHSTGTADDVSDEQDAHGRESLVLKRLLAAARLPGVAGVATRAVPLRTARVGSLRG